MQRFVEAEIHSHNNSPSDKREYVGKVLKDLDTPASLEIAI